MNTTPACPYFGQCGGCAFQDVPYTEQLTRKADLACKVTGFKEVQVFSGPVYAYRNRLDMCFTEAGPGFREKGKWYRNLPISHCAIAVDQINQLITEVCEYFGQVDAFNPKRHKGTYHHVLIRASRLESAISIVLNKESPDITQALEKVKSFAAVTSATHLLATFVGPHSGANISTDFRVLKGQAEMSEELCGKRFIFAIQGFFQTNTIMAEKMQEYCRSLLSKQDCASAELLDLYGGVGTFAIVNAALFKQVTMVELVDECVQAAIKNVNLNACSNVQVKALDAKDLSKLNFGRPLYVINDPPRGGMHAKTIEALNALAPEVLIYVSCNPERLTQDLPLFPQYRIGSVALFDFFPHTPHSEVVVELRKQG